MKKNKKQENVKQRILIPLGLTLIVLLVFYIVSMYLERQKHIDEDVYMHINNSKELFTILLDKESLAMQSMISFIEKNEKMQKAYLARDREQLHKLTIPLFRELRAKYQVTHFYFIGLDQVTFLRVHRASSYGDTIDRFTLANAMRDGVPDYGIELGKFGTFTLRVVYPWQIDGELVGYLELGKEIEHLTPQLKEILDVELFFMIKKSYLKRAEWEEGLQIWQQTGDWDQYSDVVMIDRTEQQIPQALSQYINSSLSEDTVSQNGLFELFDNGRSYHGGLVPLIDAGQRELGSIILLEDVTEQVASLQRLSALITIFSLFVGGGLFGLFYFYIDSIEKRLVKRRQALTNEIEKRKQTADELEEKLEVIARFKALIDATSDFVAYTDLEGNLLYINSAGMEMMGQEASAIGTFDFHSSSACQKIIQEYLPIVLAQGIWSGETVLQHVDGSLISVSQVIMLLRDEKGEPQKIGTIIRDITPRKQMEEELRQSKDDLEKKVLERTKALQKAKEVAERANKAKSTFLANMSHELRTPLNAILGFSQLMQRESRLTPEQTENLNVISHSGEHLLTLINDVLEMSKIEAGRTVFNESSFNLYRLLDNLESMFQLRALDKALQLIFHRETEVPQYVRTDEKKLRQVLINLLSNAIKFTKEGGVSVRIATRPNPYFSQEQSEALSSESTISCLYFEVEDTGEGIAPDELEKLFEPFVQSKTGVETQEGTGLGLSICRQFVQLMGGQISVSSQVGQGSLFKFHIQISLADLADVTDSKEQSPRRVIGLAPDQPTYRILIVEDKWTNRRLLVKLLEPLGFELQEASNGQEGVEMWERWQPHLILMDMRMPIMDGYEATKQIKGTIKGQATVIIALTASTFEEERAIVISAGCDDFIRKPFRQADLFDAMGHHLGVRYLYEEEAHTGQNEEGNENILTSLALAALPADLLTNLEEATIRANFSQILLFIEQIHAYNATLADGLTNLADDFEYEQILSLIQQAREDDATSRE